MIASVFGVNRILPSQTFGLTTANFSNTCKILWDEFLVHENFDVLQFKSYSISANTLFTSTWSSSVSVLWPLTCDLEVRWGRTVSLTVTWPADKATSWRAKSLSAGCFKLLCNGKEISIIQPVLHACSLKSNFFFFNSRQITHIWSCMIKIIIFNIKVPAKVSFVS